MTKKKQVGVRFDSNRTRLKQEKPSVPTALMRTVGQRLTEKAFYLCSDAGKAERAGRTDHRGQARRNTVGCQKHHRK